MGGRPASPTSKAILHLLDAHSLTMEAQRQLQEAYITVARLRQALRKAAGKIEGLDEGTSSPSQCRKEV